MYSFELSWAAFLEPILPLNATFIQTLITKSKDCIVFYRVNNELSIFKVNKLKSGNFIFLSSTCLMRIEQSNKDVLKLYILTNQNKLSQPC
mgnify:CR=1 FL=1